MRFFRFVDVVPCAMLGKFRFLHYGKLISVEGSDHHWNPLMSAPIGLNETPGRLLDPNKWAELRAFASSDLLALTYINAPYPAPDCPQEFFWGRTSPALRSRSPRSTNRGFRYPYRKETAPSP
jgi:hypothetical protein